MRAAFGLALAVAVLTLAAGCGGKDKTKDPAKDKDGGPGPAALDGTYVVVGLEVGGMKLGEPEVAAMNSEEERTVVFKGDTAVSRKGKGKQAVEETAALKVDPTRNPPEIDILKPNDPRFGVYKLEGSTLTLYEARRAEDRPRDFKGGEKVMILTLRKK